MSFRIEEKLLINKGKLIDFKNFLIANNAEQIYGSRKINSLYFDNMNYEMHNDSLEGLTPRKKIRVRNYPKSNDEKLYLEVKISSIEGRYKTRKVIDINEFKNYKKNGIVDLQYGLCKPSLYVKYDREYFKINDVRISIDNNINYKSFLESNNVKDESSIVEIKTSIKKNLDQLIKDFPFQRIRFSKYSNAVEKIVYR